MNMTSIIRPVFVTGVGLLALFAVAAPIQAHEFWIDLERGRIKPGDAIAGDLKVGQMLKGEVYPYLSNRFRTFTVTNGGTTVGIDGRAGDTPALNHVTQRPGLHVIAQHTTDFRLTYDDRDTFLNYLKDEGLDRFAELHRSRGLPATGFAERYTRCVKALVQVGSVEESHHDVHIGMPIEIVAGINPYTAGADLLPVTLIWQGKPLPNWQINVFREADTVVKTKVMTNEDGRATIRLPTTGEYLLSAVYLQPVHDGPVVWQSHWAALSFELEKER